MKASQMILDSRKMFQNNFIAVEVGKGFSYINGVRGDVPNTDKLTVVCPTLAFEKIAVKLPIGATDIIGTELPNGGIPVSFENLVVTPYISNGNLGLSAKADSVSFVTAK